MATQGKIPMLGFKAAAIKFVTLFGYSPRVDTSGYRPIAMTGSLGGVVLTGHETVALPGHIPQQAFTGHETVALTGHIPQQAFTGVYQDG